MFINPPSTSGYPCQYYFDITKSDQVPLEIQVQQPDSLLVNTTLQRPGRIIGHVRYQSGLGLPNALVGEAYLPDPGCNTFGTNYVANSDGSFELNDLAPRTYRLVAHYGNLSQSVTAVVNESQTTSDVEFVFPDPHYLPIITKR